VLTLTYSTRSSCASIGSLAPWSAAPRRPVWRGCWHGWCRPLDPPFSTKAPPPSGGARQRKRPRESPTCRVVYFYFGALQYLKLKTKNKEPPIAWSTFVCTHCSLDIYKGSALKCRLAWLVIAHTHASTIQHGDGSSTFSPSSICSTALPHAAKLNMHDGDARSKAPNAWHKQTCTKIKHQQRGEEACAGASRRHETVVPYQMVQPKWHRSMRCKNYNGLKNYCSPWSCVCVCVCVGASGKSYDLLHT
jgi:hypothetical protein